MREWIDRPYGWKMELGKGHQLLKIKPNHDTDMSASPDTIGPFGLKRHMVLWEAITFLGYADETSNSSPCLRYESAGRKGNYTEQIFMPGDHFVSVYGDGTGRFHNLTNMSEKDIILETFWEE